ncbi:MAG: hypothetical protein L6Q76_05015, partial [Polyangiaceae bacterium]|nr:hypothetical protein [Polyangiaceae bacterium]
PLDDDVAGPLDAGEISGPFEPDLTTIAGAPSESDQMGLDDTAPDMSGNPDDDFGDPFVHRPNAFIGADFEPWSYAPE